MKPVFFISDAHLGSRMNKKPDPRETRLLKWFETFGAKADEIFIVGDLFDFWFEYRSVIPERYFSVLCALKTLRERNIPIHFISGNHDFGIGRFFSENLGIHVHHDPLDIKLQGKRYYISHGDGLARKDRGYRILKRILRSPVNIALYRLFHPDLGIGMADFFSRLSRDHREIKDSNEEYRAFARNRFREGFDGVVMAHTHMPDELHENSCSYINTGDWMKHFTYGKLEGGRLTLCRRKVEPADRRNV